jgi:hypothetical protein
MLVVAGPPGSGKSTFFPVAAMGVDAFSIDDRCAQIVGSYRAIPPAVRKAVSRQCETFVDEHIDGKRSFAVETTMRASRRPFQEVLEVVDPEDTAIDNGVGRPSVLGAPLRHPSSFTGVNSTRNDSATSPGRPSPSVETTWAARCEPNNQAAATPRRASRCSRTESNVIRSRVPQLL